MPRWPRRAYAALASLCSGSHVSASVLGARPAGPLLTAQAATAGIAARRITGRMSAEIWGIAPAARITNTVSLGSRVARRTRMQPSSQPRQLNEINRSPRRHASGNGDDLACLLTFPLGANLPAPS